MRRDKEIPFERDRATDPPVRGRSPAVSPQMDNARGDRYGALGSKPFEKNTSVSST